MDIYFQEANLSAAVGAMEPLVREWLLVSPFSVLLRVSIIILFKLRKTVLNINTEL